MCGSLVVGGKDGEEAFQVVECGHARGCDLGQDEVEGMVGARQFDVRDGYASAGEFHGKPAVGVDEVLDVVEPLDEQGRRGVGIDMGDGRGEGVAVSDLVNVATE